MKLSSNLVERALTQFEAQAVPDNHPAVPQLKELFGDHTFFLNRSGLNIVEASGATDSGTRAGTVVELANWTDESCTSLAPHEPRATETVLALD